MSTALITRIAILVAAASLLSCCAGTTSSEAPLARTAATRARPVPTAVPTAAGTATPAPLAVTRAADFLDSMGANTHLLDGRPAYANPAIVANMVTQSGLRHFRDVEGVTYEATALLGELFTAYGVRFDVFAYGNETAASFVYAMNAIGNAAVESWEGVNECDVSGAAGCQHATYVASERATQQTMWSSIHPLGVTVYGPSNTSAAAYAAVGNLSAYLDDGVVHDYTSWYPEENAGFGAGDACGIYGADTWWRCWANAVAGGKPIVSTESGWGDLGTADAALGDTEGLVPPAVKADYVGRDYAFHWWEGVKRTYYFELADNGGGSAGFDAHGLYDIGGNPKPAAYEVASLRSVLFDASSAFTPADELGVALAVPSGGYADIVQKSDGSEYLLYWMGCTEYNGATGSAVPCSTPTAVVAFGHRPAAIANWILNAGGGGEAAETNLSPADSVTLTFRPQLQILQLTPGS